MTFKEESPRRMSGFLVLALTVAMAILALSAKARASTLDEVLEQERLVVLCWPHQESVFVRRMVDELGQEGLKIIGGIDIELMRRFSERLGVELEVRSVTPDFAALIPSLLAGEGDVIASSLTITEGRSRQVDFSIPYFTVQKVIVTRRDSSIDSVADLAGHVASVARGTSHEEHLLALDLEGLEISPVQFMLENYQAVVEGRSDFTLVDSTSAARILEGYADLGAGLEVAFHFPEADGFGFAVAPGSDLREALNDFIVDVQASGELDKIVRRYTTLLPPAPRPDPAKRRRGDGGER